MSGALGGLGVNGKMLVIGVADEPISVPTFLLVAGHRAIEGWYSGMSIDSQDTLLFSRNAGIEVMTEVFPLDRAGEAYARMMSGKATFRDVLSMT
jgi:propanol-preferring alcohol dehydrogenase